MRRVAIGGSVAVAALGLWAIGEGEAQEGEVVEIRIARFAFAPAAFEVPVGTTVRWTNADPVPHTATGPSGTIDTGPLARGESAAVVLDQPGTYDYICAFHPAMRATITVGET